MRYTSFAIAALMLVSAACSNDEGETSFLSEAQAATPNAKDYGWRTTAEYPAAQSEVREYY
jgi:hypothetical protein